MRKSTKDNYELHSRMDQIDAAYPEPAPEVWPMAAKFIKRRCPDDWDDLFAVCGITKEGTPA